MNSPLEYALRRFNLQPDLLPEASDLLKQISYNGAKDTLIHLGDIIAKGPLAGSLSVLSFMSTHNVSGVRGNHDQMVIEWRAWLNWVQGLEDGAGSRWLLDLEEKWEQENLSGVNGDSDTEDWVKEQKREGSKDHKWWSRVPKGWKLFSDHYRVARYVPLSLVVRNSLIEHKGHVKVRLRLPPFPAGCAPSPIRARLHSTRRTPSL
jgi:hypothetical protein